MPKLRKLDLLLALVIGGLAALMMIFVGRNLSEENRTFALIMPYANYLLFVFPILCAGGLAIAYFLNKLIGHFIFQLGKFVLVGGFNFLLDAAILNFLIFATGIAVGFGQSGFKSASFIIGITSSYLWNKHWTFNAVKNPSRKPNGEIFQFLLISGIGFFLNIGIDYVFVNLVAPFWGMPPRTWAQFSAIMAAAISLNWNFIGYKFFVFNHKKQTAQIAPIAQEAETNEQNSIVSEISA